VGGSIRSSRRALKEDSAPRPASCNLDLGLGWTPAGPVIEFGREWVLSRSPVGTAGPATAALPAASAPRTTAEPQPGIHADYRAGTRVTSNAPVAADAEVHTEGAAE
jgi:hypothetical protein